MPSDGYECVILVLNWSIFVSVAEAISALATMDLSFLKKADRIYFEAISEKLDLIYEKSVRATLDNLKEPPDDPALAALFHDWLASRLGAQNLSAFKLARKLTEEKKTTRWIPAPAVRAQVIWLAEDLVKQGSYYEGMWVAEHFSNDPDPPENCELSEKVRAGTEKLPILTVRGSACWLLQRLVALNDPRLFPRLIELVTKLVQDPNLYVRAQAAVPLSELARRRFVRKPDASLLMDTDSREAVRVLAFKTLEENKSYPGVMDRIFAIFESVNDVDEEKAQYILDEFVRNPGEGRNAWASRLLYFAIYREEHFKETGEFDSSMFKTLLQETLRNGDDDVRGRLAWEISRIARAKPAGYEKCLPFLATVIEGSYNGFAFLNFFVAFEALPKKFRNPSVPHVTRLWKKSARQIQSAALQSARPTYPTTS